MQRSKWRILALCVTSVSWLACHDAGERGLDASADALFDSPNADSPNADLPDADLPDAADEQESPIDGGVDSFLDVVEGDVQIDSLPDGTIDDVMVEGTIEEGGTEDAYQQDGPMGPNVCGDGWRDPVNEECDDGLPPDAGVDRACTSSCAVLDRLACNTEARERRLGVGRHPIAGGAQGHAVVTLELVGEAGDEAQVRIDTFLPSGVRHGFNTVSDAVLEADPVVAALPTGEYALAHASLDVDDEGLGIALHRVSNDGSSVELVGHANLTTDFSQRAPDIYWTGSDLVVGWEDESTIPRRICTRRFNEQLEPLGGEICSASAGATSRVSLGSLDGQPVRAWREDGAIFTTHHVQMPWGQWDWLVEAPASDETIALAELDLQTMLLAFSDGFGQQWLSIVGEDGVGLAEPVVAGSPRYRPALAATPDGVYLAWREPAAPPDGGTQWDANLDELWVQKLTWDGVILDMSASPIPLPREPSHQEGDQARPALASVPYWPSGAVLAAWEDLTSSGLGGQSAHGEVVLELIPTPILRSETAQ